jgi:hypothetical protein
MSRFGELTGGMLPITCAYRLCDPNVVPMETLVLSGH